MPLVIKAKHIAVGLFQCSLAKDGTMFVLSYFCIYCNTTVCSALLKLRLCKHLHSKNFFKQRNLCALLKQSICSCAVLFSIFGCGISVCALKRLEVRLRNLQLRFKLLRFWLRNSRLRFKLKNFWLRNLRLHFKLKIF